jgi:hypothetical protein
MIAQVTGRPEPNITTGEFREVMNAGALARWSSGIDYVRMF